LIPQLQDFFNFEPTHAEALRRLDAVHPGEYARTRNALDGSVTGLSPYFTHGVIGMRTAVARVLQKHRLGYDDKLTFEFAWREFFHHVWTRCGEQVLTDMRPSAAGSGVYSSNLPADLREARTGVPAIDTAVRQLYATGYLHNHARMWLASYAVHLRKVHWRAGADWMYGHLLDGDVPSNHLSWQWVAGTFSSKPYLFNADNVAKYAPRGNFKDWRAKGTAIDQDYEVLERIARHEGDVGPEPGVHQGVIEPLLWAAPHADWVAEATRPLVASAVPRRREIELVTPWAMGEREGGSGAGAGGPWRLGVIHTPSHALLPWSEARWRWVLRRLGQVTDAVFVGDLGSSVPWRAGAPSWPGPGMVMAMRAPMPGYDAVLAALASLQPAPRLLPNPETMCRSFSVFYESVKRQSRSLQTQLNGELF
jgi:deoxyribodipyrimidine photo-lyase